MHPIFDPNWLPTPDNVNKLPDGVRKYIHDLETNSDPQGILARNALLEEESRMIRRASNKAFGEYKTELLAAQWRLEKAMKALDQVVSAMKGEFQLSSVEAEVLAKLVMLIPRDEDVLNEVKAATFREAKRQWLTNNQKWLTAGQMLDYLANKYQPKKKEEQQ